MKPAFEQGLNERLEFAVTTNVGERVRENLCSEALARIKQLEAMLGDWDAETVQDIRRMLPGDIYGPGAQLTQNPVTQVYFRAGLIACREYMARFVEQGGDVVVAQSIRANWWPSLGDDPGPPRRYSFDEVAEEIEGPNGQYSVKAKEISPSVEALARAFVWLHSIGAAPPEPPAALTSEDQSKDGGA